MKAMLLTALLISQTVFAADFSVHSSDIKAGTPMSAQQEFNGFGCSGANLSPQLQWQNAPAGTKSFAITVFDPDAPTGSGWWHWNVINIPASTTSVAAGSVPKGALETRTDYGSAGFGGACPPAGDPAHRYIHTIWALDIEQLPLDAQASGALVGYMLNQHKLGTAQLITTYQRKK
ncbi:YbhB/YbcL family Raf kinase inhibitor-like protein [Iodobacter sp. HSC-16F04]|uniref:YbhB/YbcL family Raf kinase inhibitor-like protein n=1 Tax=Iodobacter violaceini TaxID=3044271 RepID=A0ABX0KT36_9NEIS|nr:YbhB/YbcL family Raf kinase inhibitor-like protein [Iodobacter violacea]NHQ85199.1 YbhB/YbcL family Raf kinase inhibitor-like protein [Iodobacter violacea]